MVYPILTDYLGCVRSISDVLPSGDASTAQKYRRNVDIENGETSPSLQCGMTWKNSLTKKRFRSYHPQSSLLLAVAELTNKEGIWFTCEAMITNVNENRGWKYNFKATVNDATANVQFIFFTNAGEKITGTPSSTSAPATKSMETRKEASEAKGESEFIADDVLDIKPGVQIQTTRIPSSTSVPAPESMEERQETTKGKEKTSAEEGTPPTNYSTVVEHPKKWEGTDTTQVKSAKRALFKQQSAEPKKRTGD
ncbi:hypothetical protein Tco_0472306 [Tanacetum coccineum]